MLLSSAFGGGRTLENDLNDSCFLKLVSKEVRANASFLCNTSSCSKLCVCVCVLVAQLCLTPRNPWIVAHQAPLSMVFSRQEYWSGLPFPSPEDLPDPGIEPRSPALQAVATTKLRTRGCQDCGIGIN